MPTQRISVAKIGGKTADLVARQFDNWHATGSDGQFPPSTESALDDFADTLRVHSPDLPIVYFSEWIDMWSSGDLVPGLRNQDAKVVAGRRYEACCHRPPIVVHLEYIDDNPTQESVWLHQRVKEAADAWGELVPDWIIVILREVFGSLVQDHELQASLERLPDWLPNAPRK